MLTAVSRSLGAELVSLYLLHQLYLIGLSGSQKTSVRALAAFKECVRLSDARGLLVEVSLHDILHLEERYASRGWRVKSYESGGDVVSRR